ncbi:MAG: hypothetical protein ING44_12435 [Telmatospirillum sp.]|nr:hypothetical protein [Telmatospirillum sp.]
MERRSFLLWAAAVLLAQPAHANDPAPGTGDDPGAEIFLPRMLVPAIQNNQVKRHYALLIKLRLIRRADVDKVRASMDRLQNAFVYDLNDIAAQGDNFDRERAKRRLTASAVRILGSDDIIEEIVFERVLERRIGN